MRPEDHSYTVDDSSFGWSGGRYVSAIPMTAGKNAGRALMRRVEADASLAKYKSAKSVSIKLRDTTKIAGAKEKIYFYKVTKVSIPLKDRVTKTFNGVNFTPEYTYEVKSIDEATFGRSK